MLAHRHGKSPADDVAQNVEYDDIPIALEYSEPLKLPHRSRDAQARATCTSVWPTGFYTCDTVGAPKHDVRLNERLIR